MRGRFGRGLLLALVLGSLASRAGSEVFLTTEQALAEAFPGRTLEKTTLYFDDAQAKEIEKSARAKLDSRIVTRITSSQDGVVDGYGYFDTHIVRTMPETILVVLEPDASVRQVLILAFAEPDDYRPRPKWLAMLEKWKLDPDLWPGRGVPRISGSTLTTQALTDAVRRVLAIHKVTASGPAKP